MQENPREIWEIQEKSIEINGNLWKSVEINNRQTIERSMRRSIGQPAKTKTNKQKQTKHSPRVRFVHRQIGRLADWQICQSAYEN